MKPRLTALGQPLQMAAHTSDWSDSLNRRQRGGKRNTEHHGDDVYGGSCFDAQQIFGSTPTVGFLFSPEPLLVKLLTLPNS